MNGDIIAFTPKVEIHFCTLLLSCVPNAWAIGIEKPWASPVTTAIPIHVSQSEHPMAANAFTPRCLETMIVSQTVYSC